MTQHTDPIDSQIQRIDAALTRNAERLTDYDTATAQARPAMTFADARAAGIWAAATPTPDTDHIPLRTVPTREDRMTAATDPHATCHDRDACAERVREVVDALTAQRDRVAARHREALEARDVLRAERDQAYAELDHVSAALDRTGANGAGSLGDRIDAAAEALAAGQAAAQRLEVERDDLRIALGRAETETAAMVRDRDEVIRERNEARNDLKRATHTIDTQAEQLTRVTEERDVAQHLVDVRTAALQRRTGDPLAAVRVVDAVRSAVEQLDRAMAAYDAPGDLAESTNARRQTAAERPDSVAGGKGQGDGENGAHRVAEGDDWLDAAMETADSILVDNRDRIWRPAPDGTYRRHPFGNRTRASLDAQYGPTQAAMVIYLDGPGHVCDPIECACELSPTDAPLGSGPARVQGSPDRVAQATRWIDAAGIPVIDRDVRAWLDRLGVPVPVGIWPLMTEIRRAVIAAGDAGYAAAGPDRAQDGLTRCCAHPGCPRTYQADVGPQDRGWRRLRGLTVLCPDHAAPEPIRAADWEQRAVAAVGDALADHWGYEDDALTRTQMASDVVRAIIDAGLAGPGGRCPACGHTYPRTMPAGEDPRCWTCSAEPDPAALAEHRPGVARVLDKVRNGRPANTPEG